ncbi:MAG: hypothetical protein GX846_07775 [Deltaproteobacteria bacterium]|nr:hypothetical protein [Deltaproteobacteria bacterium]
MKIDDVSKYLIDSPFKSRLKGKNQGEVLTYASDTLIPGLNYYAQLRWIKEMPEPDASDRALVSDCNKIVLFWGNDYKDPEELGAEIEFMLDGTPLRLTRSSAIFIPAGVSHGPAAWKGFTSPHMEMTILINRGNRKGEIYADKAPVLKHLSDPEQYLVRKPAYEVVAPTPTKNRMHPSMTFMSNNLVPGANTYLEFSWIWGRPDPDPHIFEHIHESSNELVFHIGSDPDNPESLGAEIEIYLDERPLMIKKTSALYAPANVSHGPLKWKAYTRPHIEMAIVFDAGALAQSDPGGHQKNL